MRAWAPLPPNPRNISFVERRAAWRAGPQRFYARHHQLEPYAPAILAVMFDRGVREVDRPRCYAYRVRVLAETVRINVDNWHWYTASGSVEGRGLYELWAWRFDIDVPRAAAEIWACIQSEPETRAKAA